MLPVPPMTVSAAWAAVSPPRSGWQLVGSIGSEALQRTASEGIAEVADGTPEAARRLDRVLWNDPATGVMRHADAGYDIAIRCAREQGLDLPSL